MHHCCRTIIRSSKTEEVCFLSDKRTNERTNEKNQRRVTKLGAINKYFYLLFCVMQCGFFVLADKKRSFTTRYFKNTHSAVQKSSKAIFHEISPLPHREGASQKLRSVKNPTPAKRFSRGCESCATRRGIKPTKQWPRARIRV